MRASGSVGSTGNRRHHRGYPLAIAQRLAVISARTGGWRSTGWQKDTAMNPMNRDVRLQGPQACEEE